MFFTLNRCTLQLNMFSCLEHVFHAEPLHTSAKHALKRKGPAPVAGPFRIFPLSLAVVRAIFPRSIASLSKPIQIRQRIDRFGALAKLKV